MPGLCKPCTSVGGINARCISQPARPRSSQSHDSTCSHISGAWPCSCLSVAVGHSAVRAGCAVAVCPLCGRCVSPRVTRQVSTTIERPWRSGSSKLHRERDDEGIYRGIVPISSDNTTRGSRGCHCAGPVSALCGIDPEVSWNALCSCLKCSSCRLYRSFSFVLLWQTTNRVG